MRGNKTQYFFKLLIINIYSCFRDGQGYPMLGTGRIGLSNDRLRHSGIFYFIGKFFVIIENFKFIWETATGDGQGYPMLRTGTGIIGLSNDRLRHGGIFYFIGNFFVRIEKIFVIIENFLNLLYYFF